MTAIYVVRLLCVLIKYNPAEVEKSTVKAISEISLFKSDVWFAFIAPLIILIFITDKTKKKKRKKKTLGSLVMHSALSNRFVPSKKKKKNLSPKLDNIE